MKKTLSEMEKAFVKHYAEHGNASKAAVQAGYSPKFKRQQGYELCRRLHDHIQKELKRQMGKASPVAMQTLVYLMNNAESETVRLAATKDLLDRSGFKPTDKVEQVVTEVQTASTDELKKELDILLAGNQNNEEKGDVKQDVIPIDEDEVHDTSIARH